MSLEKEEIKITFKDGLRETDPYSGGVTQSLAGDNKESKKEFYSLSDYDIRVLQKEIDKKSKIYIDMAKEQGLITEEDVAYLRPYYQDTMTLYGKFYDILISALGHPQGCHRNDLEDGEKDNTDYSQTYITPNNSMILTYDNLISDSDIEDCKVYLSLPGIKNVIRAVEKIKKGGKYDQAYQQELKKLEQQYSVDSQEYQTKKSQLIPPYKRLKDILRATISVPIYDSIDKIIKKITSEGNFQIAEAKDKFNSNLSAQDNSFYENKKNYRDKKICFYKNGYYFEIQFKVQHLEQADKKSHFYYEKLRQKIDKYGALPMNSEQKKHLKKEIIWLERDIQKINRKGIDDYNQFILDVALKKDTRIKKEKIRNLRQAYAESKDEEERQRLQREIYKQSQSINSAPVTQEAEAFIKNNFMVRPYKALNMQDEFSNFPPKLQSFAMLNYFLVSQRYRGSITGNILENYQEQYELAQAERRQQEQNIMDMEFQCYKETQLKKIMMQDYQKHLRN